MALNRKEKERQTRRELLLESATRVFGRKPFDEATMQEVAAEAEIGMQGLYEHFPSKQELYEQVMLRRAQAFHAAARAVFDPAAPPLVQLRALARVYITHFLANPFALPLFIRDRVHADWGFGGRFYPHFREVYDPERAHLAGILEAAVAEGSLRDLGVDFLAPFCLGTLEASLHSACHRPGGEDVETCLHRAMTSLLNGAGTPARSQAVDPATDQPARGN